MMRRLLPLLLPVLFFAGTLPALAEQSASVLRDTELRSEPFSDAAVTAALKSGSALIIVKRQGGWYQARQGSGQGWVRMSAVRLGEAQDGGRSGIGETLRFLNTGRSGASGVTVATGIRGLDTADLANATPDHDALKGLGRFQVSAAQARAYAAEAKLRSSRLAYLEANTGQTDSGIPGIGEDW